MTTEPQIIVAEMLDHLAVALDALWEDGEQFTTYDEFGQEVEFSINEEMTTSVKAQVLASAMDEMRLVLPLIGEHCLSPDYLQRFADNHCQQARKRLQEKCDEVSREIRNHIFEV